MNIFRKSLAIIYITIAALSSSAFANFLVVTPEQVSISPKGLFVTINGISIAIESLNAANDGYLVAIPIPSPYADRCPNCGSDTYTQGRTCSNCGFPIWDGDTKKLRKS